MTFIAVDYIRSEGIELEAESEAFLRALDLDSLQAVFGDMGCLKGLIRSAAIALQKVDNYDGDVAASEKTSHGIWKAHASGNSRKLEFILVQSSAYSGC